jgi:hypothetical protein
MAMSTNITTRKQNNLTVKNAADLGTSLKPLAVGGKVARAMYYYEWHGECIFEDPVAIIGTNHGKYGEKALQEGIDAIDEYIDSGEYERVLVMAEALRAPPSTDMLSTEIMRLCACFPSASSTSEYYAPALLQEIQEADPAFSTAAVLNAFNEARRMKSQWIPSVPIVFDLVEKAEKEFRDRVFPLFNLKNRRTELADALDAAQRGLNWYSQGLFQVTRLVSVNRSNDY